MLNFVPYIFFFMVMLDSFFQVGTTKNIFVDKNLTSDITNGMYSIENRDNSGNDGDGYRTVQAAVDNVEAGDIIYLRGGQYFEQVFIPARKRGTPDQYITMRSYNGEWAVIDREYKGEAVIYGANTGYSSCPAYWEFSNLEVTRGGGATNESTGYGFMFDTAHHMIFDSLIVHNIHGSGENNSGGIVIKNEDGAPYNIIVRYCYFKDIGNADNKNLRAISTFGDYVGPPTYVEIDYAMRLNEFHHNFIDGGTSRGVGHKSRQFLCLDYTGSDSVRYRNYADKVHHNIIRVQEVAIEVRQDFVQVYNNLILGTKIAIGEEYAETRNPFHAWVYNNTIIGGHISLENDVGSLSYDPPYWGFFHCNNNIIVDGPTGANNSIDIMFTWSYWTANDVRMETVDINNNLFYPANNVTEILNVGKYNEDFNIGDILSRGWAQNLYVSSQPGLWKDEDNYELNMDFNVADNLSLRQAGLNINHPYLENVVIPQYLGHQADDDHWVPGVLRLKDLPNLWSSGVNSPEAPKNIRISK